MASGTSPDSGTRTRQTIPKNGFREDSLPEQFRQEAEARLDQVADRFRDHALQHWTGRGSSFVEFQRVCKHDPNKETELSYEKRKAAFIGKVQTSTLTHNPPAPLYTSAELAAHPAAARMDMAVVERKLQKFLEDAVKKAIADGINDAIKEIQNQSEVQSHKKAVDRMNALNKIARREPDSTDPDYNPQGCSQKRADKIRAWIVDNAASLSQSDIEKLNNTGLIKIKVTKSTDPVTNDEVKSLALEPHQPSINSFRFIRNLSYGAWGLTIAATALTVGTGIALGGFGIAMGCAAAFVANAANGLVQRGLRKWHDDKFLNTWKEVRSELDTIDVSRCPAFAGLMYLLIDQYSPVQLLKNQAKFLTTGQPSSVDAVRQHLVDAAGAALHSACGTKRDTYFSGMNYKEKLNLAKVGIENLEGRWNYHWNQTKWWAATLTTFSGIGTVAFALV